ncbi:MAG TPA: oligosaccharide flippase family protein [Gaiellaceae bacterium]|nr:oligosaccharide flippase family protein [Gaiellaceae bacterium]
MQAPTGEPRADPELADRPPVSGPPRRRPLTGGAAMSATSRIAVTALGAATTILIARLLGPSGSGTYFVAQSLLAVLLVATTLGVEHGITYFVSSRRWPPRAAYMSSLRMALVMGAIGAVLGLGARLVVPSAFAGMSVWLTAALVGSLFFALVTYYARFVAVAIDRYEAYVLPPPAQAAVALACTVPAALLFGVEGAVLSSIFAVVLMGVAMMIWAHRQLAPSAPAEHGQLRRAISFGVKGYAANAIQLINYRLDLFILASVASTAVVGRYAIAVAATSLLSLLPSALSDVVFPRVASLSTAGEDAELEMVETKSVRHAVLIVVTSALGLVVALELLVVPVFGEAFQGSIDLGLILIPGAAAIGLAVVLAATVVGRGKPIYQLYVVLAVTPVTILLYATLIPSHGATGAALASTVSYLLSFVLECVVYKRVTGRRVLALLIPSRSELDDLLGLGRALRARVIGR